jgi:hypothetical protein
MATVQAITLKFSSLSSRDAGAPQLWSCKFHLSGAAIASQADAETAALGLADPILGFCKSTTWLEGWLHYPADSDINDYQATYVDTDHPGTTDAYVTSDSGTPSQQIEVCALLRAPTKPNAKGRMGYLFKYVHDIQGAGVNPPDSQALNPIKAGWLDTYNTGIDPSDRIPVAPDGTVPSGDWSIHEYLVTRQMRRGQVPKA